MERQTYSDSAEPLGRFADHRGGGVKVTDLHNVLCAWGVWYDGECKGPDRNPEPQPWAKKIRERWRINTGDLSDEEFMEEIHGAFLRLSADGVRGWSAACILAAHYRDWRLSDRKQPQPFVGEVLRAAQREFRRHLDI
jgi:hypothetical protein